MSREFVSASVPSTWTAWPTLPPDYLDGELDEPRRDDPEGVCVRFEFAEVLVGGVVAGHRREADALP